MTSDRNCLSFTREQSLQPGLRRSPLTHQRRERILTAIEESSLEEALGKQENPKVSCLQNRESPCSFCDSEGNLLNAATLRLLFPRGNKRGRDFVGS